MGGGGAITFGSKPSPGLGRANGEFPRPKTGGRIPGFRGRGANLELRDEDAPGWPGGPPTWEYQSIMVEEVE